MSEDIVIVAAARTPIGEFMGSLSGFKAHELGAVAIKEVLTRAKISTPEDVDEVILGQVLTAGQGQNPARQAAVKAGIPYTVPAYSLNMLCGSGLKAVILGYQSIRSGDAKIVVCGGQESMSQAPHAMYLRPGTKLGNRDLTDLMIFDGLTDAFHNVHMGETAENVAEKFNIGRDEQDKFSLHCQQKAESAIKNAKFKDEIAPVVIAKAKQNIVFENDEYPKLGCLVDSLQKLKPVFRKNGSVTAGNASGINDGAAAVVLMSYSEAKERGLSPLARIVAYSCSGIEPLIMGLGPVDAVKSVLKKAGWEKDDVDLYEINDAFASLSIAVLRELGVNPEKVNIHGGAIALGHPIGASGTRIIVTLLHALQQTGGKRGIASLCIGGGMGIAMAVEKL
ncbi:hypothetical protein V9T40_005497 [Parthenolecanium corni]|uniref:Acetyl-CoA acetyltransferase n=1 Tax=Parthenolecanium corni TaxID=536013 RepID=A0AAN9TJC4_9HEMI